jgi:hypothetical protein
MSAFATVTQSGHVTVWEEAADGHPTVRQHLGVVDVADLPDDTEVFAFDVPTSIETGTAFNRANKPYVDADGKPVWEGAHVSFAYAYHHVNVRGGDGVLTSLDAYGNANVIADREHDIWFQDRCVDRRRNLTLPVSRYEKHPELGGVRRLLSAVGDRFEHGQTETAVRVVQDPRDACIPVPRGAPKP